MDLLKTKPRRSHPLHWVVEPLVEEPSYIERAMFGCRGCYLYGRLVLVLAAREEPWNGLLIPTEKKHHASLLRDHKSLVTHPVLKKWLYLPESDEGFEESARVVVESILANNLRIGVESKPRSPGRRSRRWKRSTT